MAGFCMKKKKLNCTVVDSLPQADTPNVTVAGDTIYLTRTLRRRAKGKVEPAT
jgi:hypothetical protein